MPQTVVCRQMATFDLRAVVQATDPIVGFWVLMAWRPGVPWKVFPKLYSEEGVKVAADELAVTWSRRFIFPLRDDPFIPSPGPPVPPADKGKPRTLLVCWRAASGASVRGWRVWEKLYSQTEAAETANLLSAYWCERRLYTAPDHPDLDL